MMNVKFSDIPPVVKNLILINIIMLLATWVLENTFGVRLSQVLGLHYFKSEYFHPYQIVTHMFMHGGLMHLFFNMFALWMFGSPVEYHFGWNRFLFIYISAGFGAVALQLAFYYFLFFF